MPDELDPNNLPPEPSSTTTDDALNVDLYADENDDDLITDPPAEAPVGEVVETPAAVVPDVEAPPAPEVVAEPVPAFDYKPQLPNDMFTADERAYIRTCEDSTDVDKRLEGRQFEAFRMQQYTARSESMAQQHVNAIPATVMDSYGPAVRDYMAQVPAERRNDPHLNVEVVLATAYEHAKQLGGGQAGLARVIADLNERYNGGNRFVAPAPPAPRKAAVPPAAIPASAAQPRSSVAAAPAAAPSDRNIYEAAVKKLVADGMDPGEARAAVSESKR